MPQARTRKPSTARAAPAGRTIAWRWRRTAAGGRLDAIDRPQIPALDDLLEIDRPKQALVRNTEQFVRRLPANNALLWGARGTGKSSLVRALLGAYREQGLRMVEVAAHDLVDLPDIVAPLHARRERFLVYCDDLSFEANDPSYKALKAMLDGSLAAAPPNVLIYATSNRRHLMPEFHGENAETYRLDDEIHPGESVEEKISLSDRFGLWVPFHPFTQEQYLAIVAHSLARLGSSDAEDLWRAEALRWALARGSRSGRTAWQFARDWVGRRALGEAG